MSTSKLLYQAMVKKYEADIADAKARLSVYFNNPVAIGEHPQITEEIDNLIEQMASAEDKLGNLIEVYKEVVAE
jgi:hypothetical protein